jgi:hypothetical protein
MRILIANYRYFFSGRLGRAKVFATHYLGVPREISEKSEYSTFVLAGDPEALAMSILYNLADLPKLAMLKVYAMDFALERVADMYLGIVGINSVLNKTPNPPVLLVGPSFAMQIGE